MTQFRRMEGEAEKELRDEAGAELRLASAMSPINQSVIFRNWLPILLPDLFVGSSLNDIFKLRVCSYSAFHGEL
jgi:hypothetical protein